MAFRDSMIGSDDFDPQSAIEDMTRRVMSDEPMGSPLDPAMVRTRLMRKLLDDDQQQQAAPPPKTPKAPKVSQADLDFSSQAIPASQNSADAGKSDALDFTSQVNAPPPAPEQPGIGVTGNIVAAAKGIPTGAAETVGGGLKGAAALYQTGHGPVPEMPQVDVMGSPTGIMNPAEAAVPPKPPQERSLYKAGQAVEGVAPTMTPAERESLGGRVGTSIGGILPYAALTAAGGPLAGMAAGAVGMGIDSYGKVYEDAIKHGATEEVANAAATKAAGVAGLLGSLPIGVGAYAKTLIGKIATSGATFATLGEAQEALLEQIKKDYDPKAGYTLDQKRIIASLITGGLMGGLHHAFDDRQQQQQPQPSAQPGPQPAGNIGSPPPGGAGANARGQGGNTGNTGNQGGPQPGAGPTGAGGPQPGGPQPGAGPQPGGAKAEPGKPPPGTGEGMGPDFTMDPQTRAKMERVYSHFEPGKDPSTMADHELYNAVNEHLRDTSSTGYTAKEESPEEAAAREATAKDRTDRETLKGAFAWMTDAQIDAMAPKQRDVWLKRAQGQSPGNAGQKPAEEPPQAATPPHDLTPEQETFLKGHGWTDADIAEHGNAPELRAALARDVPAGTKSSKSSEQGTEGDRNNPIIPKTADDVTRAVAAEPTPAQADATNYKHAHMELPQFGLVGKHSISIETGVGQVRKGTDASGKPWEVTMEHGAYGRLKATTGSDGQPLDAFVGPHPTSPHVFIIDQHDPKTGAYDEHKLMLGYRDPISAMHAYANSYNDGGEGRIGHVTAMGPEEFKAWMGGDTTKPLGKEVPVPNSGAEAGTGTAPLTETPTGAVGATKVSPAEAGVPTARTTTKGVGSKQHTLTLLQFIAHRGGIQPDADLLAIDAHKHRVQIPGRKGFFGIVKKDGLDPDKMREAAEEAGYLGGDINRTSTVRELYDLIDAELRGQKRHAQGEEGAESKRERELADEQEAHERERYEDAAREFNAALDAAGHEELTGDARQRAIDLMMRGETDPEVAVETAVMQLEAEEKVTTPERIDDSFGPGAWDEVHSATAPEARESAERAGEGGARPEEEEEDRGVRAGAPTAGENGGEEEEHAETGERLTKTLERSRADADRINKREDDRHALQLLKDDLPEGASFIEGKGELGRGKFAVKIGDETKSNYFEFKTDAIKDYRRRSRAEQDAADQRAERADKLAKLKVKIEGGADVTDADLKLLDLKRPSDLRYFIPAASELFGVTSRAVRPKIASLIRKAYSDNGTEYENVDPVKALRAMGQAESETGADNKEQIVIPGADKIGYGEQAQRAANRPLQAKAAQKPMDTGLFGDERNQTDIFDNINTVKKALGDDAEKVEPDDIQRAGEIMVEQPGIPVPAAFGQAVIENAVDKKQLTPEKVKEAYGEKAQELLDARREGTPGGSAPLVEGGAAPHEEQPGAAEGGELPRGRKARKGKRAVDTAAPAGEPVPDTGATERPAAGGGEAAGNEAGNAAENVPAAKPADKSIAERDAPTWAEILHELPMHSDGRTRQHEIAFDIMSKMTDGKIKKFSDLDPQQKTELLARVRAVVGKEKIGDFGEPEPRIYTGPVNEFDPEHANGPLGEAVQHFLLDNGMTTGNEWAVALRPDGTMLETLEGDPRSIFFGPKLNMAASIPGADVVIHHNHPSGSPLSHVDVAQLALPGIQTIWAHGHNGTTYRASLTDAVRNRIAGSKGDVTHLAGRWNEASETLLAPMLPWYQKNSSAISNNDINSLHAHLTNEVLRIAGIIHYETNYLPHPLRNQIPGLLDAMVAAVKDARKDYFNDGHPEPASADRRTGAVRHPGNVGALLSVSPSETLVRAKVISAPARREGDRREAPRAIDHGVGGDQPRLFDAGSVTLGALGDPSKVIQAFKHFWTSTFQPELVSDRALTVDPLFAKYRSAQANEKDAVIRQSESEWNYWNKRGDAERIRFLDDVETAAFGAVPPDPRQAAMAKRYRAMLDANWAEEKRWGSQAAFVQDYFPHIWERPDDWRAFAEAKSAQMGPTWFQKKRTIDYITDGLAAGLKLKYTNPVDIIVHRLLSGVDMRQRMQLLYALKDEGLTWNTTQGQSQLIDRGWRMIVAPDRKQWVIHPDVQLLWKNAVEAKGLWQDEHVGGSMFRGWMAFKNAFVPVKLALSAFHPLHVLHINYANGMGRAWDLLAKNHDPYNALKAVAKGFTDPIVAAPGASIGALLGTTAGASIGIPGWGGIAGAMAGSALQGAGKRLGITHDVRTRAAAAKEAWGVRPNTRAFNALTPEQKADIALMHDGGFVPQLSEQLKIGAKRQLAVAFQKALRREATPGDYWRMIHSFMRRGIEKLQAPIFERWIPQLKTSAYLDQASDLMRRNPAYWTNHTDRRLALRAIAKSIDNRFGEMFYGNLFWNRYLKDTGIGAFLSLGWNLGFVREFGGAAMETVSRPAGLLPPLKPGAPRKVIREASNKIAFAIAYMASAALINAIITKLSTGDNPEGLDYIFSRIGGNNPDGTPRRITNMFYLREVPMLLKHIQERGGNILTGTGEMIYNKLMIEPFRELMTNRDYYGYNIWDENAPIYKQMWQATSHMFLGEGGPMSVSGARHAADLSGQPFPSLKEAMDNPDKLLNALKAKGVDLSLMGFGPAPAYVEKNAIQNRISYLYGQHVAPASKPHADEANSHEKMAVRTAIMIAKRDQDSSLMAEARERGRALGLSPHYMASIGRTPTDVYLFSRLPIDDQRSLLRDASPEDRSRYLPHANRQLKQEINRARYAPAAGTDNEART